MKHIKTFEDSYTRKFKPGDIVKYKFSNSQPFEILSWSASMYSYRVKDLYTKYETYLKPYLLEIYPPEKLEEWYMKRDAKKYNL